MNWNNDEYESVHEQNVSVNLFFERIYSNIYIPKEQSAKDEKTLEQSETPEGAEGFKQLN